VRRLASLKNKTRAGLQTRNTGASQFGHAQVNVGAATVDASPTEPPIPKNHRATVELRLVNLGIGVCLNVLRWFRHCALGGGFFV
jgi:hypothetical protein